jgi:hypothetical protein
MNDKFRWPEPEDDSDRQLISDVKEFGWHAVGVDPKEDGPPFVYTIGLFLNFGQPELVVIGLPHKIGHGLIANIVDKYKNGESLRTDVPYSDVAEGYDVRFQAVSQENYRDYFGYALWFYRSLLPSAFPVLQLVWPDREGRFPADPDFSDPLRRIQLLLG